MTTNDSTMPEILENAEFVTVQLPLSNKARAKRALKTFAWTSAGTVVAMIVTIKVVQHLDNKIPLED